MGKTDRPLDKGSHRRGKMIAVYVKAEVHEQAQHMKDLGIIPSISSLWMDGYQSALVKCSKQAREREVAELRERADRLAAFYAEMDVEGSKIAEERERILSEYRERSSNPYVRKNYRTAQMTWLEGRMADVSAAFPDVQSIEEAYTVIESLVAVRK